MKYPEDEKQFEDSMNEYFRRSGYWAHHMDTSIPGFPDTLLAHPGSGSRFIEYKFIRTRGLNSPMIKIFQSDQPAQLASMLQSGAKITLLAFHIFAIYSNVLIIEKIFSFRDLRVVDWLDSVNSYNFEDVRKMIRNIE